MGEIVIGVAASHTTLMNTRWAEVDHLDKQTDIAFWLGVSRQRVAQLAKKDPAFPAVAMTLPDGTPLYRPMDVMRYTAERNERLGKDA